MVEDIMRNLESNRINPISSNSEFTPNNVLSSECLPDESTQIQSTVQSKSIANNYHLTPESGRLLENNILDPMRCQFKQFKLPDEI